MTIPTKLKISSAAVHSLVADVLVVPLFEGEIDAGPERVGGVIDALGRPLREAAEKAGFEGKAGQSIAMHSLGKLPAARIVLLGLGKSDGALHALREGMGEAARAARAGGDRSLAVALPSMDDTGEAMVAAAAAEGSLLGSYRFDRYVSGRPDSPKRPPLKTVTLLAQKTDAALRKEVRLAEAVAEATMIARDLVNEPPGMMTPDVLAKFARAMAKEHGLKCTVKGRAEIERLKMGLFRGVSLGADTEPRLIVLKYQPAGRSKRKGIALVGKGITFDSGGYDLKPAQAMDGMKMDMGGAATAVATMRAVAAIKPPFPVTCFVGACENLISGRAYKPGDVLKSRSGLTVEVNNTDAEGRLVLGDLLTYACEQGFDEVVDIATLTGACMIALGPLTFGAFSNDEDLAGRVLAAAAAAGEDGWRMPLNKALAEQLRSDIADTKNTGERPGGAITAALFLSSFVGQTPWLHLDIAGPAMYARDKGAVSKGASGVGVRTLAKMIRDM